MVRTRNITMNNDLNDNRTSKNINIFDPNDFNLFLPAAGNIHEIELESVVNRDNIDMDAPKKKKSYFEVTDCNAAGNVLMHFTAEECLNY